jgi:hypothetical protein
MVTLQTSVPCVGTPKSGFRPTTKRISRVCSVVVKVSWTPTEGGLRYANPTNVRLFANVDFCRGFNLDAGK